MNHFDFTLTEEETKALFQGLQLARLSLLMEILNNQLDGRLSEGSFETNILEETQEFRKQLETLSEKLLFTKQE